MSLLPTTPLPLPARMLKLVVCAPSAAVAKKPPRHVELAGDKSSCC